MIIVVGLSHKTAPIEVRERLALSKSNVPEVLGRLLEHPSIGEAMVLSTCNRVEVYAAARSRSAGDLELAEAAHAASSVLTALGGDGVRRHLLQQIGKAAVRHLFRVAASLDSLVVGEPQILGQLKDSIEVARGARSLGATLGNALHRAVRVGKRVRTETAIGAGQVSVSSVAVELARQQVFGDLEGRTTVLIGAGEMAEAAAKLLVKAGGRLVIVNRSLDRAEALAQEVGGVPRPWSELERSIIEADIVVSSTSSPGYVITEAMLKNVRKARKGRSLFLIDIAVPRDIDPAVNQLDNVYLYDVDDLSQIVAESLEGRASEAERAAAIAEEEAQSFEAWTQEQALTPAIVALRARTRSVLGAELDRSLHGKLRHLGAAEREALEIMLDAATNKLLHGPVARLRELATDPMGQDYLEAIRDLFALDAVDVGAAKGVIVHANGVAKANGSLTEARGPAAEIDTAELSESV
ncbi:Glutamyl-tRNA reductase [Minicystis rosea]|nr:Glutamyl-tRNA reductase [Minicystis rosea]